jgi:hypothetical protein
MSEQYQDFFKWMPLAAALAAWVAAFFAYLTARRSGRALRLAERQEERRRPTLVLYLHSGYLCRTDEDHVYMFLLSVSNPSDSDNAIARLELRIKYITVSDFPATVNVPNVSQHSEMFPWNDHAGLEIPVNVDAHKTVAGRVFFLLKHALLKGCTVDGYEVIATDSHENQTSIEVGLVQELVGETEIKKN